MGSKTALVVDDSKSARFALRKYLEGHSFHVDTAESAEEAYSFLKAHRPDLIFLDHVMPGIDGFEALRHIKSDPQAGSIPVVICSSNEGAEFTAEARHRGAADVLQKPPSPDQLGRILEGLQRLSTQLRQAPAAAKAPEPAAPPSRVSNIVEPDVAIEQAVMKQIRSSLPTPTGAPFDPAATGRFLPPAAAAAPAKPDTSATQFQHLREQIEARMKKITQDMFVQVAELKAGLATLESRQHDPQTESAVIGAVVQDALTGVQGRLESIERGVEMQLGEIRRQLAELRTQTEAALRGQTESMGDIVNQARAAAREEAHDSAERTVMAAASRIADQLADSILKSLGRR